MTLACLTAAFSPIAPARAPPRAHGRAGRGRMGLFDFMKGDGQPVSPAELEAVPRGMVAASHILLATAEEAEALKARLDAGELTFEDAAIECSTCPSGKKGGDLGSFRSIGDLLFLPYEGTWRETPLPFHRATAHVAAPRGCRPNGAASGSETGRSRDVV